MPFKSQAQARYLYSQHPEIARRWAAEYGQKIKSLPARKKLKKRLRKAHESGKALEFVYGQPSHPSPAAPFSQPAPPASQAAVAASHQSTPKTRYIRRSMLRSMAKVAKRVKYRLRKMGYLKGEQDVEKPKLIAKAFTG
jgi:hypothetical protein